MEMSFPVHSFLPRDQRCRGDLTACSMASSARMSMVTTAMVIHAVLCSLRLSVVVADVVVTSTVCMSVCMCVYSVVRCVCCASVVRVCDSSLVVIGIALFFII